MFRGNKIIKGVKSTNERIEFAYGTFGDIKSDSLDLSECDFQNVKNISFFLSCAQIDDIIFPSWGFKSLKFAVCAFFKLKTSELDLSGFNFFCCDTVNAIDELNAPEIILPVTGLSGLMKSMTDKKVYSPLEWIPKNSQTEEACWAAVSQDKRQGQFVKIKSKKILMYLGTEYPEYTKFYYNEGD